MAIFTRVYRIALSNLQGLLFVGAIVFLSVFLARIEEFHESTHLAATALAIIFGALLSPVYFRYEHHFKAGVHLSAKKLLRLGIILYGFNITITELAQLGIWGMVLASVVIISVFVVAYVVGVKFFKLDKETVLLVGAGSAICGAAAVLALEASLKSESFKGIVAVGTVVIFGLFGMFLYPIVFGLGWIPLLDGNGMGIFMGATLHEVANVAGAAEMAKDFSNGAFSQSAANAAIILKMMRVILLVPFLLIVTYFFAKEQHLQEQQDGHDHKKLQIPYFAFGFLGVIVLNTYLAKIPEVSIGWWSMQEIIEFGKLLCVICIVFAMAALGLQIDFKKFIKAGGKAFGLALVLCFCLMFGGYFLVLGFEGIIW